MRKYVFRGALKPSSEFEDRIKEGDWEVELRRDQITLSRDDATCTRDELWQQARLVAKTILDDLAWHYGQRFVADIDSCEVSTGEIGVRVDDGTDEMRDTIMYRLVSATVTGNFEVIGPKQVYRGWSAQS